MTDQQIIDALIARDERVTQQFFFRNCRPLFLSIIRFVFSYEVDYNEFVNEFYLYLMENDAYRLKQFEGRSSIYQWLKTVAIRFFIAKRNSMIDMTSKEALLDSAGNKKAVDDERIMTSRMDIDNLMRRMTNKRYVYVIKRLILDEAEPKQVAYELGTNVDNLYNIKKRAIESLTEIALNEIERYEKTNRG